MKFKTLEGSERIRFLGVPDTYEMYSVLFDSDVPCTGKHCAEHKPTSHMWVNKVKSTGKSFTTRVRCTGPGCQICEAFNE